VTRPWKATTCRPFTVRQVEFLRRTADGETYHQIGAAMGLTAGGVSSLSRRVLRKLDARSAAHAVRLACEAGIIARPLPDVTAGVLTARQLQILAYVADGYANGWIARTLGVSVSTVKNHLHEAYGALGAADRTNAVKLAYRAGLIDLDGAVTTVRSAA
jgi:DNA-binding NarL/FixJ family response regulator